MKSSSQHNLRKGFTLIELLIVVGIIGVLFAVVLVALNPIRLLGESRNASRWVHVSQIIDAVQIYSTQNDGSLPNSTFWSNSTTYHLGTAGSGCSANCTATGTQNACLDLSDLVAQRYLANIPVDSQAGTSEFTDFYIRREGTIITAGACEPELGASIQHTR